MFISDEDNKLCEPCSNESKFISYDLLYCMTDCNGKTY